MESGDGRRKRREILGRATAEEAEEAEERADGKRGRRQAEVAETTAGGRRKIRTARLRKVKTTGVEGAGARVDGAGVEYGRGGGGYSRQWEEYGGTRRTAGDTAGVGYTVWAAALEDDTVGERRKTAY